MHLLVYCGFLFLTHGARMLVTYFPAFIIKFLIECGGTVAVNFLKKKSISFLKSLLLVSAVNYI